MTFNMGKSKHQKTAVVSATLCIGLFLLPIDAFVLIFNLLPNKHRISFRTTSRHYRCLVDKDKRCVFELNRERSHQYMQFKGELILFHGGPEFPLHVGGLNFSNCTTLTDIS